LGVILFLLGMTINLLSDHVLRTLRSSGHYQIPHSGLFHYTSGAHYFGELLEWAGYVMACHYALHAVAFFVYTASNLIPRARSHHAWYRRKFGTDYPNHRTAIIPFLW
jgi:steroid 5-alpha reductase family enzyme